jgi:hypothetical protein
MKKIIFTLLVSVAFSTLQAVAAEKHKREITKEFAVGAGSALQISNKYGNIRIIEGTENKILFKIEITGEGKTQELAREYAESVSIDFSQSGDRISAETVLPNINCNNCGRTTHYVVVVPKSVTMTLENKYGNIQLDDAVEPLKVDLKYGNMQANALGVAMVDIKYGKTTIRSCEQLMLDCKYSEHDFGQIGTLKADSKYDKFRIKSVSNCTLETGYTQVKIDRLLKSFVTDVNYCALDISEVAVDFSRIKIDAAYTNVNVALNKSHSCKVALSTKYGNINAGDLTFNDVSLNKKETIVGRMGTDSDSEASVEISVSYGNISFK